MSQTKKIELTLDRLANMNRPEFEFLTWFLKNPFRWIGFFSKLYFKIDPKDNIKVIRCWRDPLNDSLIIEQEIE